MNITFHIPENPPKTKRFKLFEILNCARFVYRAERAKVEQTFCCLLIYSVFCKYLAKTVFKMDENSQVETAKSVGLVAWIFKILSFPFTIGNLIYKFLLTKQLKNCLPGKVVLITGASSGLGEALAHTFYIAGCKVVLAARRKEELERVRKDLLEQHSVSSS